MTLSTVIFYTGIHPYTLKPVSTVKSVKQKQGQNSFFFWYKKEKQNEIVHLLKNIGREDLAQRLLNFKKTNQHQEKQSEKRHNKDKNK